MHTVIAADKAAIAQAPTAELWELDALCQSLQAANGQRGPGYAAAPLIHWQLLIRMELYCRGVRDWPDYRPASEHLRVP